MLIISMEGEQQIAVSVPLFLKKLWRMVNDKDAEDIISWNSTGDGFVIYDQLQFVIQLLPKYFKHNNMASFIRQLNFYDFHKVASIDKDEMQFSHNCFLKDLPETLVFIKRKCTTLKSKLGNDAKEEQLEQLLSGVKDLKNKHTLVDNEIKLLKQENAALWSEINSLRVKHSKQSKIINKLIHFLISYMHSHQNSMSKRNRGVTRKNGKHIKTGPTILEIDYHKNPPNSLNETIQNPCIVTEPEQSSTIAYKSNSPVSQAAILTSMTDNVSHIDKSTSSSLEKSLPSKPNVKFNILENPKENLGSYVDSTQLELNSLQDILSSLNANELANFYTLLDEDEGLGERLENNSNIDLEDISEVIYEERADKEDENVNLIKKELVDQLAALPTNASISEEVPDQNGTENEGITTENIPDLVDEYFNPEYKIRY